MSLFDQLGSVCTRQSFAPGSALPQPRDHARAPTFHIYGFRHVPLLFAAPVNSSVRCQLC